MLSDKKDIEGFQVEEIVYRNLYRNLYGRGEAESYKTIDDEAKPSCLSKVCDNLWDMAPNYTPWWEYSFITFDVATFSSYRETHGSHSLIIYHLSFIIYHLSLLYRAPLYISFLQEAHYI